MNHPTIDAVQAKRVARAEFVTRLFIVVLIALLVASLSTIVVLLGRVERTTGDVRDTQLEGTPLGKKIATSADAILDCTQPSGKCFRRSQAATAKAVGDINRVVILAAACAPLTPGDVNAITKCVVVSLAEKP